jgi:hypothetical protein
MAWRNEDSVEEIGEKEFHIDIWVLRAKLDTECVYILKLVRHRSIGRWHV